MRSAISQSLIGCWLLLLGFAHADQATFVSPDGRYILETEKNKELGYRVNLIDVQTHKLLDSYNPETRAIEAFWNSTSTLVAIDEDISHTTDNLSLFRIVSGRFQKIELPSKLRYENLADNRQQEAIYHFILPEDAKRKIIFFGAHGPCAIDWINTTDLNVGIAGYAELDGEYSFSLEYDLVLHVVPPKASILSETKKQYEISQIAK